jgi:hypothetical protein
LGTPDERKTTAAGAAGAALVLMVAGVLVLVARVLVFVARVLVMPPPMLCRWHILPFTHKMEGEFDARLRAKHAARGLNVEFV